VADKKPVRKASRKPSTAKKASGSKSATPAKRAATKKVAVNKPAVGAIGSVTYVHDINKKATRLNVLARWFKRKS